MGERNRSIDVARMFAAFLIVAYHAAAYHDAIYHGRGDYAAAGGPSAWGHEPKEVVGIISLWGRVPFFFLLSGCFAARSLAKPGVTWWPFLQKRLALLAIPYLFWNCVALAMVFVAARQGGSLQGSWNFSPQGILMQITGFGLPPADSPLWFVRDLLLASCLAPLMVRAGWWLLVPSLLLALVEPVSPDPARMAWPLFSSFGFFGLGILLNRLPAGTFRLPLALPGWTFLLATVAGLAFLVTGWPVTPVAGPLAGAAGILMLGCFVEKASPRVAAWIGDRASASFMIFAANAPFFAVVKQVAARTGAYISPGLLFVISSVVFFFLAIFVHQIVRSRCPILLKPLTGGR